VSKEVFNLSQTDEEGCELAVRVARALLKHELGKLGDKVSALAGVPTAVVALISR
jgi:hypothetical protein